jgi:hypothetical protein
MTAHNSPQRRRDRGGKEFSIKIKILSVLCVSAVSCYRLANPWFFFKENKGVVSGTSRLGRQNRMHTQLCLAILLPLPLVALAWRLGSPLRFEPPPSGRAWTLPDICVINIKQHHLAAGPSPAHNRVAGGFYPPAPTSPSMRVRTIRFTEPSGPWSDAD